MTNDYFTTLRNDHPLFQRLKKENPTWWQFVKENIKPKGFYVDLRKDNSLNIYYNGGSLLKITLLRGEVKGIVHESYLKETGTGYVNYVLNRLPEEADKIKKTIAFKFADISESGIKARLILAPGAKYIDSEFAYPERVDREMDIKGVNGKKVSDYKTTRIDLTKLENGKIVFVELKRIEDGRLLTNKYEDGNLGILTQMRKYNQFIKAHKQEITGYYKTLFTIKRDLGILPESLNNIDNIDDYELCEGVELYIEPYSCLNSDRKRRIEAIKTILDKNNIIHNLPSL